MHRAVIAFALILIMLITPAYADTSSIFAIGDIGSSALVSAEGEIIVPVADYSMIAPLTEGLFAAKIEQGWEILDEHGMILNDRVFSSVVHAGGNLICGINDRYCILDLDLNNITQPVYTRIVYAGEEGFLALKTDPYDERADIVYRIDPEGNEEACEASVFFDLSAFYCGLSPAMDAESWKMGYLAPNGTWAIEPVYSYADCFMSDGYAVVTTAGRCGLVDAEGKLVVEAVYPEALHSDTNSVIAFVGDESIALFDTSTESLISLEGAAGSVRVGGLRNHVLVTNDTEMILVDALGDEAAHFDTEDTVSVMMPEENVCLVTAYDGMYALSLDGSVIFDKCDEIIYLGSGLYARRTDGLWTVSRSDGNALLTAECDRITLAFEDMLLLWRDNAWEMAFFEN